MPTLWYVWARQYALPGMIDNGDHSRIEKCPHKSMHKDKWYCNRTTFQEYPDTPPIPQPAQTPAARKLLMVKLAASDPGLDKFKHRLGPMIQQINSLKRFLTASELQEFLQIAKTNKINLN